jgi:hypothetical protein
VKMAEGRGISHNFIVLSREIVSALVPAACVGIYIDIPWPDSRLLAYSSGSRRGDRVNELHDASRSLSNDRTLFSIYMDLFLVPFHSSIELPSSTTQTLANRATKHDTKPHFIKIHSVIIQQEILHSKCGRFLFPSSPESF